VIPSFAGNPALFFNAISQDEPIGGECRALVDRKENFLWIHFHHRAIQSGAMLPCAVLRRQHNHLKVALLAEAKSRSNPRLWFLRIFMRYPIPG
jgi:hypothetical protein